MVAPPPAQAEPAEPAAPAAPATARLGGLQALRGAAAAMVVLFHLEVFVLPHHLGLSLWDGLAMGYAGVEIFFVLSGFIMAHVHGHELGLPGAPGRFLWRRAVRILPIYWLVLLAVLAGRAALGGPLPDGKTLLASALLLPVETPVLRIAWTLSFEALFYLVFALVIWRPAFGRLLVAAWLTTVLAALALPHPGMPLTPLSWLVSPYLLLFALGVLAGRFWTRLPQGTAAALVALGVLGFFGIGLGEALAGLDLTKPLRTLLYGGAAAAMIAGLAAIGRSARLRTPRLLVHLGDASYALYLLHLPVMVIGAQALAAVGLASLPAWCIALVLCGGACGLASAVHLGVEAPLMRALHRAGRRASAIRWHARPSLSKEPAPPPRLHTGQTASM
ncbi:MAG: acyltransferase [Pseudomonadota bacterium]